MFNNTGKKIHGIINQMEDSDIETDKIRSVNTSKNTIFINPKRYLNNNSHPECIFTNEDRNISYYESNSNNSFKERKYLSMNPILFSKFNTFNYINRKNSATQPNCVEEKFPYNFENTQENNEKNQRILNNFLLEKCNRVPKTTIKTYQAEFDVEKSDNFNLLSFKPQIYKFDNRKNKIKKNIIQIFKKERTGKIFYQGKLKQSSLSPTPYKNLNTKKVKSVSYKTPALKLQSFSDSYVKPKKEKNNNKIKVMLQRKKNQLEDFNIDKLIEIGDKHCDKWRNILSFGKKIKNIRNKDILNNTQKGINYKKINQKENINGTKNKTENLTDIIQNYPKKIINKDNNYLNENNGKKVITKKIIYRGRLRDIKNFKNSMTYDNRNEEIRYNNKIEENIDDNMNKTLYNKNMYQININNNNLDLQLQDLIDKPKPKGRNYFYRKTKGSQIYKQITPKKLIKKTKIDIGSNNSSKLNSSINNFKHLNNFLQRNKYNNTMMNKEKIGHNELEKNLLYTTEKKITSKSHKEIIKNNKDLIKRIKPNNQIAPIKNNEYIRKKYNNYSMNKSSQKIDDKDVKVKNYYGYDERHNLEGTINNHSYYVSVYSKKKINQKSYSKDKIKK